MNQAVTYRSLRASLKMWIDRVCVNHAQILVTRKQGENVVIISQSDYLALEETAYLLRSPRNKERILDAYDDVKNGINVQKRELF